MVLILLVFNLVILIAVLLFFYFFPDILDPWSIESLDGPVEMDGSLYICFQGMLSFFFFLSYMVKGVSGNAT